MNTLPAQIQAPKHRRARPHLEVVRSVIKTSVGLVPGRRRVERAGLSDTQIAERLVISPHTVHRQMANILAKLRQPTRAAAAAAAARAGLL